MEMKKMVLYIYGETPMHVGTGVGLGAVDMPIQREKHTGYPIIQASGVKGALRDTAELGLGRDSQAVKSIFGGSTGNEGEDFAGAMSPSDARILLFPVRALNGVFMWITSPTVLERFQQETGLTNTPEIPKVGQNDSVHVSSNDRIVSGQIMLEEYTYLAQESSQAYGWGEYFATNGLISSAGHYWQERMLSHLVILPDDEFRDFVRYSTDIVTRIHIDDAKKTVKDGQLFTQELLPADSLMYSLVYVTNSRDGISTATDVINTLAASIGERMQIGGDETVGRGRVTLKWQEI